MSSHKRGAKDKASRRRRADGVGARQFFTRKALQSLAIFLGLFLLFFGLYAWFSKSGPLVTLSQLTAAAAGELLPSPVGLQARRHALSLSFASSSASTTPTSVDVATFGFVYGMVLTGALILAMPNLALVPRAKSIFIAWMLLFATQVGAIAVFGWAVHSALQGQGSGLTIKISLWFMYVIWAVLPPLFWIVWSFRYWLLGQVIGRSAAR